MFKTKFITTQKKINLKSR